MEEDTVSGLMISWGYQKQPKGLQKQIGEALGHTRKWRVTANVDKFTVLVCNGDSKNPAKFTWKCGEE